MQIILILKCCCCIFFSSKNKEQHDNLIKSQTDKNKILEASNDQIQCVEEKITPKDTNTSYYNRLLLFFNRVRNYCNSFKMFSISSDKSRNIFSRFKKSKYPMQKNDGLYIHPWCKMEALRKGDPDMESSSFENSFVNEKSRKKSQEKLAADLENLIDKCNNSNDSFLN